MSSATTSGSISARLRSTTVEPELFGEHVGERRARREAELDEQVAEALARRRLLRERVVELLLGDETAADEQLAERATAGGGDDLGLRLRRSRRSGVDARAPVSTPARGVGLRSATAGPRGRRRGRAGAGMARRIGTRAGRRDRQRGGRAAAGAGGAGQRRRRRAPEDGYRQARASAPTSAAPASISAAPAGRSALGERVDLGRAFGS